MVPSGRFDALVDMGNPLKGIAVFPFLSRFKEGRAFRAVGPAAEIEICRICAPQGKKEPRGAGHGSCASTICGRRVACKLNFLWNVRLQLEVKIGKHAGAKYDNWRRVTRTDLMNPAFQAALVQAHREHGG